MRKSLNLMEVRSVKHRRLHKVVYLQQEEFSSNLLRRMLVWKLNVKDARGKSWFKSAKKQEAKNQRFWWIMHTVECVAGLLQLKTHIMSSSLMWKKL